MHGSYEIETKAKSDKKKRATTTTTTKNNGTIIKVLKRISASYYYRIVIVAVIIITQLNENVSDVIQHPHSGDDLGVSVENVSLASIINQALSSLSTTAATTTENATERDVPQIPAYIRTTSMVFCITIMLLGVIGNLMVCKIQFLIKLLCGGFMGKWTLAHKLNATSHQTGDQFQIFHCNQCKCSEC